MEEATKNVQFIAQQHLLPERPHQLCLSANRRYRVPPKPTSLEEQHVRGLQYMTLVTDGDRGFLYTRGYYDIREDDAAIPNNKNSSQQPETKKIVNKLSLKDYKNKQKNSALSTPETAPVDPPPKQSDAPPPSKTAPEVRKPAEPKASAMAEKTKDIKVSGRDRMEDDRPRKLPLKPETGRGISPSVEKRKRELDVDDARFLKRSKADNGTPRTDSSRTPRLDGSRAAESRDKKTTLKEVKSGASPVVNGRSTSAVAANGRTSSPRVPGRDSLTVNGNKSSGSTNTTPKKEPKPSVPPLLSPLHLPSSFGDDSGSSKKKTADKPEKETSKLANGEQRTLSKRPKSRIPPLLSPTLPAVVEEELARIKKTPTKPKKEKPPNPPDSPTGTRRIRVDRDRDEDPLPPKKQSLVVVLKYKKRSKDVSRILALPPASKKEALRKEREQQRKRERERERERSRSADPGPPVPVQAKKRPRAADAQEPAVASKRPRTSEANLVPSSSQNGPSTPSKSAPVMSRVASNNSAVHTPGDTSGMTPSSGPPDKPTWIPDEATAAKAARLRSKGQEYIAMGTRIKHTRDGILGIKTKRGIGDNNAQTKSLAVFQRGLVLGIESVMAYMLGFRLMGESRDMERKVRDPSMWESLMPHLRYMKNDSRQYQAVHAVVLVLTAITIEEMSLAYTTGPDYAVAHGAKLANLTKMRYSHWEGARHAIQKLREGSNDVASHAILKVKEGSNDVARLAEVGPWTTADEAVGICLRVLRRWSEAQVVEWVPEVGLPARDRGEGDRDRDVEGVNGVASPVRVERESYRDRDRDRDRR